MAYNYFHVDAFTGKGLLGNPAGVCLLKQPLAAETMQKIAAELYLPEISFVWDEGERLAIRWFTPDREVDLCGHGTLAAAQVIFTVKNPALTELCFRSASGMLYVRRKSHDLALLSLDFPVFKINEIAIPAGLTALLDVNIQQLWQSTSAFLVVLESEQQVRRLQPDIKALIANTGCGVIVTAPGDEVDFVSRFFTLGGNEDPVTGSAHCTLMPYWAARLGKNTLTARQISARGGALFCTLDGDRTLIAGYATIFMKGEIIL